MRHLVALVQVFEEAFFVPGRDLDDVGGGKGGEEGKPGEGAQRAQHEGGEGGPRK